MRELTVLKLLNLTNIIQNILGTIMMFSPLTLSSKRNLQMNLKITKTECLQESFHQIFRLIWMSIRIFLFYFYLSYKLTYQ